MPYMTHDVEIDNLVGIVQDTLLRTIESDNLEAREHIKSVIEQLERDVRDRNFKPLC